MVRRRKGARKGAGEAMMKTGQEKFQGLGFNGAVPNFTGIIFRMASR